MPCFHSFPALDKSTNLIVSLIRILRIKLTNFTPSPLPLFPSPGGRGEEGWPWSLSEVEGKTGELG
jgi:hypothetical protein